MRGTVPYRTVPYRAYGIRDVNWIDHRPQGIKILVATMLLPHSLPASEMPELVPVSEIPELVPVSDRQLPHVGNRGGMGTIGRAELGKLTPFHVPLPDIVTVVIDIESKLEELLGRERLPWGRDHCWGVAYCLLSLYLSCGCSQKLFKSIQMKIDSNRLKSIQIDSND